MKKSLFLTLLLTALFLNQACTSLRTQEIEYTSAGVNMKGYFAYDASRQAKRPGVLVVHEWWGHNDYARKRARMLAKEGYLAFAIDMYGDGKLAGHPKDAGAFAGQVRKNMEAAEARFRAALHTLKAHPYFEAGKAAAIGYCFGGGIVLEMARRGLDLKGVASFHGSLGTAHSAQAGKVKARVLVLHGADDSFISAEQIEAFKQEMQSAGVDYQFVAYPGAKHSFTNPGADEMAKKFGLGIAYNKEADRQSWKELRRFLKEIFG